MSNSISNDGNKAEKLFSKITGYKINNPKGGADIVGPNGRGIEVKRIKYETKQATINQVRAIKKHILVVLDERNNNNDWYIVPASVVIRKVINRKGQHGKIPYETVTLSVKDIKDYLCSEDNITSQIENAISIDEKDHKVLDLMDDLKNDIEALAEKWKGIMSDVH